MAQADVSRVDSGRSLASRATAPAAAPFGLGYLQGTIVLHAPPESQQVLRQNALHVMR